ncbi:MAG: YqcI/YcgG family protein [Proteobacteria bacterium]|nr:MAG: YqcI/YcgG family protein [Pseudomonadota bacterium]
MSTIFRVARETKAARKKRSKKASQSKLRRSGFKAALRGGGVLVQHLIEKIQQPQFPCIMAKSVMNQGVCENIELKASAPAALAQAVFEKLNSFIDSYRANKEKLHSCIISFSNDEFKEFAAFEKSFWEILQALREIDDKINPYDPRVSSDPRDGNYSFSVKEEAFFILLLHPKSPRKARQFAVPSIVFNPHQQFEDLRAKGTFHKVRSTIRARDERYQGALNPMLMDFGSEVSEIHQYSGLDYTVKAEMKCPFKHGGEAA